MWNFLSNILGGGTKSDVPEFQYGSDDLSSFKYGPGDTYTNQSPTGQSAWVSGTGSSATTSGGTKPAAKPASQPQQQQGSAGSYPSDKYIGWDPTAAQADWEAKWKSGQTGGGGGGGGGYDVNAEIEKAFGPGYDYLNQLEQSLRGAQTEDISGVENKAGVWGEQIGTEQGELESTLTEQERKLGEVVRSAYADALRSYNNLIQQGLSRFGAGSSAGPAVQELVNQEFLRTRGKLGQQEMAGVQQAEQNRNSLNNYVSKKKDDLKLWKEDAIRTINGNFQTALNEIAGRRYELERDKSSAKLQALQNAADQAQSVKNNEQAFRMGLAQFAVEQAQKVENRSFSPQEIAAIVQPIMSEINIGFGQSTAATSQLSYNPYAGNTGNTEEELRRRGLI